MRGSYGDPWQLQRLVFQQLSIGNSPPWAYLAEGACSAGLEQ